jgi:hypothetical protein
MDHETVILMVQNAHTEAMVAYTVTAHLNSVSLAQNDLWFKYQNRERPIIYIRKRVNDVDFN